MKPVFSILILILSYSISIAQTDPWFDKAWEDIEIKNLNTAIHKMTAVSNHAWGFDFGSGFVYKSTDGGTHWRSTAQLGSEYFERIQFLDTLSGFISGDYGFVYKTVDGGETWIDISPTVENRITEKFRNDSTKNQEPDGMFAAYYGMHFIDNMNGYVSGFKYNPKLGFRPSYQRLFFETQDGGETWQSVETNQQRQVLSHFGNELVRDNLTFNNTYYSDESNSWKTAKNADRKDIIIHQNLSTSSPDTLLLPEVPHDNVLMRSIVFLNPDHGFIFGGSWDRVEREKAVVYQTIDGGKSWRYLATGWPHLHHAFKHQNYLWVTGKEGMIKRIAFQEAIRGRTP